MLKKLLKYDLISILKFLSTFYLIALLFSILTRVFTSIDNSLLFNIIGKICSGTYITMIFNILINCIIRTWVRFKHNLYGDESYLTHTLPIKKSTLYLSKICSSLISILTSFIVIIITAFIAYYSKENINSLNDILNTMASMYNSSKITLLFIISLLLFLEFVNISQIGYTGIILGQRKNKNKALYAVIYSVIAYALVQITTLISLFIKALFNDDVMNLFFTKTTPDITILKSLLIIGIITYSITYLINYYFNLKQFEKGVNVD